MENTHTAIIKFRDGDSAEVKGCAMMALTLPGMCLSWRWAQATSCLSILTV